VRIGVDVGGTYSDLVLYDDVSGQVKVAKRLSTPDALADGVAQLVASAMVPERLPEVRYFLHGTTVAINALHERRGAVVGLLTTRGFRDVLEVRRGDRDRMYDLLWKTPPPLVPRHLRLPVTERIRADMTIELPLDAGDVRHAATIFAGEAVESVAVVFINSYANPEHELQAERILRESGFQGAVSLSHRISREYREYERCSTTVVDAYVRPQVSGYLRELEGTLLSLGTGGQFLVTRSGGGAMTFGEAEARPFETIMSGPVGGAMGAGELCQMLGIGHAITADVGGTSFDTCLIVDGRPQVRYEGRVAGMPLQTPWVDVRSIGAGGGSIAFVDGGGLLRVGPRSAGAVPGPACFGRGGTNATVTDAAAALGMLAGGDLAGGVRIDNAAAVASIRPLAGELGMAIEDVARGIVTIASSAMADSIRSITVEQGYDPRTASLIAFGGAGPLLATLLAHELDIEQIVVPCYAGNFSAWGLLGQEITRSMAMTSLHRLDKMAVPLVNEVLRSMYEQLGATIVASERDGLAVRQAALDLRYVGQEYTLTLQPPGQGGFVAPDPGATLDLFVREYERTFGHILDEPVEVVTVRATVRRPWAHGEQRPRSNGRSQAAREQGTLGAFSFTQGRWVDFAVVHRDTLSQGARLLGPAIVAEETATTYVDSGFELRTHEGGALVIRGGQR
jgi:N-methylhydantoinase A